MQKQFTKEHSFVVKGVAILLLLMYHLFEHEQQVTGLEVNYSPFPLSGFLLVTGFGNICVAVFVFLTAFGIAGCLQAGDKEICGIDGKFHGIVFERQSALVVQI